ncbi:MAG: hypothetical protein WCA06_21910 [Terrimicrobiaceae bacterium]
MKTATFSAVVQAAGTPTTHLLLVPPEKDKVLQAAIRGHRVMTLHQRPTGNKADYGTVGFESGGARQYLIFPKSLSEFQEMRIIAIRYELLEDSAVLEVIQGKAEAVQEKEAKPAKPRRPAGPRQKRSRKDSTSSKPPLENVVHFERQEPDEEGEATREIKNQVRRAMEMLEEGKQVAAFNLLKRIVDL